MKKLLFVFILGIIGGLVANIIYEYIPKSLTESQIDTIACFVFIIIAVLIIKYLRDDELNGSNQNNNDKAQKVSKKHFSKRENIIVISALLIIILIGLERYFKNDTPPPPPVQVVTILKDDICSSILNSLVDNIYEGQHIEDTSNSKAIFNLSYARNLARIDAIKKMVFGRLDEIPAYNTIVSFLSIQEGADPDKIRNNIDEFMDRKLGIAICSETLILDSSSYKVVVKIKGPQNINYVDKIPPQFWDPNNTSIIIKGYVNLVINIVSNNIIDSTLKVFDQLHSVTFDQIDYMHKIYLELRKGNNSIINNIFPNELSLYNYFEVDNYGSGRYILTTSMCNFIDNTIANLIRKEKLKGIVDIICRGYTDEHQVRNNIMYEDNNFYVPVELGQCLINSQILLTNPMNSNYYVIHPGQRLRNNCELSYARSYSGIIYLSKHIREQNNIRFSYQGCGVDSRYIEDERQRRIEFEIINR